MLAPGDEIDIWVVERRLGSGGMGSVYKAHNRGAERIAAAVKVLEGSVLRTPGSRERFVREAEILFGLDHPNIVKVRNIRSDHEPPYLEMEFVSGEPLEARIGRGPIPFPEALHTMRQMADAVAYLHDRGVRHRDIKPANVVVADDGHVTLVDFGLAMEADAARLTQQGVTFGTVSYAPPEWIRPERLDPAAWDLYALGVCFYEMLTGRIAFPILSEGSARQQAMQVILSKQRHPPLDPGESFDEAVRALVRELTAADPADRPGDASRVAARVAAFERDMGPPPGVVLAPPPIEVTDRSTWLGDDVTAAARAALGDMPTVMHTRPPLQQPWRVGAFLVAVGLSTFGLVTSCPARVDPSAPPARVVEVKAPVQTARDAMVVVSGLSSGTPLSVRLGDSEPAAREGWRMHFPGVPLGEAEITWVLGEGCAPCPGEDCPRWCGVGTEAVTVARGAGPAILPLELDPVPVRDVTFRAPSVQGGYRVTYRIDGARGESVDARTTVFSLTPGAYTLVAEAGSCPESARGCQEDDSCPPGCSSLTREFVVPWGTGDLNVGASGSAAAADASP